MSNFQVDLGGRTALVTGAGAGSGRAIALALAANGASVAVNDLNIERADAVAEAIRAEGGSAIPLGADISNRFQTANMIERARDAFGGLGILVNAAGIFHPEPMLTVDEWNWRRQIEVNITGAFFCIQLVGRVMAAEGGGSIINLSAVEAYRASLPEGIGYIASKAAIIGMTRQAARELAPYHIRANCIAARTTEGAESSVAGAALFLCSAAAKSISGQVIALDSGSPLQA
ncbi:MAG: SDR family NAD(P)-dependent oxidoreductase [Chloroflexota bacterium]|nr:SDR family NAD(P)-dependent oxidoreductase [Chloroflexota bacterium]